jgi:hypothetical protein
MRSIRDLLVVAGMLALAACGGSSSSNIAFQDVSRVAPPKSIADMSHQATLIATGTMNGKAKKTTYNPKNAPIGTISRLAPFTIATVVKGDAGLVGKTVTISQVIAGDVNRPDFPGMLVTGQRYLVFLTPYQGKWFVIADPAGEYLAQPNGTFTATDTEAAATLNALPHSITAADING